MVGRIHIQSDVVRAVASANNTAVGSVIVARGEEQGVLPLIRQFAAADGHSFGVVVQRHHHHVNGVGTGHINAGVAKDNRIDNRSAQTLTDFHGAQTGMLYSGACNQSGLLRNVGLVQSNKLRAAASSDGSKTDVRIAVGKSVDNACGTVQIVSSDIQCHRVSVAEDLTVGTIAVQAGDGTHHRIGLHMHVGNTVATVNSLEVEDKVADGIADIANSIVYSVGVRQLQRGKHTIDRSGVPHRNRNRVVVIIGRIHVQSDVVRAVASANNTAVGSVIVARGEEQGVLPLIRQFAAADGHSFGVVVQRHHHHVNGVGTGHIKAGVAKDLGRDQSVGGAFDNINSADSVVLHNDTHDQSCLLRNVRLVQCDKTCGHSSSDSGKADVGIRVSKSVLDGNCSVGVINVDVQINGITVAEDLAVGTVAVQIGNGVHHRIGLHMHVSNAVATVNSLEVEDKVADGIADIAGSIVHSVGIRQFDSRNVAVHG